MANSSANQQVIDEINEKLEEVIQTASCDSPSTNDEFMDTAALDSAVSINHTQVQSLDFQNVSANEIEQIQVIQASLSDLTQKLSQHKESTKDAIRVAQNKSKLNKAYR